MLKLPSYLTGFSSKSDGSASIKFATQELTPDDFGLLKENLNSFGWLVFSEQIREEDVPTENVYQDTKSPSTRQRDVLFLVFKTKFPDKKDFDTYYRKRMEIFIDKIKEELNH
jgi:hypothetical protein